MRFDSIEFALYDRSALDPTDAHTTQTVSYFNSKSNSFSSNKPFKNIHTQFALTKTTNWISDILSVCIRVSFSMQRRHNMLKCSNKYNRNVNRAYQSRTLITRMLTSLVDPWTMVFCCCCWMCACGWCIWGRLPTAKANVHTRDYTPVVFEKNINMYIWYVPYWRCVAK